MLSSVKDKDNTQTIIECPNKSTLPTISNIMCNVWLWITHCGIKSKVYPTPSLHPSNMLVSSNIQSLTVCHLFVEPVGTTRPKFDSRLESSTIAERQGAAMALTCLAQSNPAPVFRFVL